MLHEKDIVKLPNDTVTCLICGNEYQSLVAHLTLVHEISCDEYKEEFGVDHVICDEMRTRLAENMRARWQSKAPYIPMDRKEVIRRIRKLAANHDDLSSEGIQKEHPELRSQGVYIFGNWTKALIAAGIDAEERQSWTDQRILQEIRARHKKGKPINYIVVKRENPKLCDAGMKHFGSWRNAIEKAGFDYSSISLKKDYNLSDIARQLQVWSQQHGLITPSGIVKTDRSLYWRAKHAFGSIEAAAEFAELPYKEKIERWTPEQVLGELRKRIADGLPVNCKAVLHDHRQLYSAACRYFGNYKNAVAEARK